MALSLNLPLFPTSHMIYALAITENKNKNPFHITNVQIKKYILSLMRFKINLRGLYMFTRVPFVCINMVDHYKENTSCVSA